MSKPLNPTTRRALLTTAAVAAVATAVSTAAIATAGDPLVSLSAEALQIGRAWNAACGACADATDAAEEAGLPSYKPEPDPERQTSDGAILEVLQACLADATSPEERARYLRAIEKHQPKADLAKAAREAQAAQAYHDAMAKWYEADRRFGITAADARAEELAEAFSGAVAAVLNGRIETPADAFAVTALAYWCLADRDEENAKDLLAKVAGYLRRTDTLPGLLPLDHPRSRQTIEQEEARA